MSNKTTSIYFAVLAILYFSYTIFIAKHGIHFTNVVITVVFLALSFYYYMKNKK